MRQSIYVLLLCPSSAVAAPRCRLQAVQEIVLLSQNAPQFRKQRALATLESTLGGPRLTLVGFWTG